MSCIVLREPGIKNAANHWRRVGCLRGGGFAGCIVGSFAGIKCALGGLKNSLASAMLHQSLLSLLFITYWNMQYGAL
ncbi:MAG: hypothetical protein KAY44_03105 [Neisseria sp.]|nr:hypothetical protein [Neisseria sp.]MBP8069422.1 hypothetical protein [Neisseria sp.]